MSGMGYTCSGAQCGQCSQGGHDPEAVAAGAAAPSCRGCTARGHSDTPSLR
jgi:hypothetical protein